MAQTEGRESISVTCTARENPSGDANFRGNCAVSCVPRLMNTHAGKLIQAHFYITALTPTGSFHKHTLIHKELVASALPAKCDKMHADFTTSTY